MCSYAPTFAGANSLSTSDGFGGGGDALSGWKKKQDQNLHQSSHQYSYIKKTMTANIINNIENLKHPF